ncbi:DUF2066 domain-containing protein [Vibrio albus]|nr:DUF2066 domain-containing protein [Vibrio albus]
MRYIAFLLLGLLASPSYALTNVDVYSAEVLLDGAASDAENTARRQGMAQVIVRATGDKQAADNPVVIKALRNSGEYLSQIGYGTLSEQQTLRMVFNAPQIRSLLTQAQLPFWSEERASVLVWLVEETRYGRDIVWEQSEDDAVSTLKYYAGLRGLPVTVPVGDIEDVTGISPPELWGGFVQSIGKASERYPADAVLVLRISGDADNSQIRYTLYDDKPALLASSSETPVSGQSRGSFSSALEQAVDQVSDYFSAKNSVQYSGEASGAVTAQFIEINSSDDFFALEKQIKALNSVAGVDLMNISGNEVTLRIHLLTSEENFEGELTGSLHIRKFDIEPFGEQLSESVPEFQMQSPLSDDPTVAVESTGEVVPVSVGESTVVPETQEDEPSFVFEWVR